MKVCCFWMVLSSVIVWGGSALAVSPHPTNTALPTATLPPDVRPQFDFDLWVAGGPPQAGTPFDLVFRVDLIGGDAEAQRFRLMAPTLEVLGDRSTSRDVAFGEEFSFTVRADRAGAQEVRICVSYSVELLGEDGVCCETVGRSETSPFLPIEVGGVDATPTATATASPPGPTRVPTWTPTPEGGPATCPGDCDQDGSVVVAELVRAVRVVLGLVAASQCPGYTVSGVDDLIRAVNVSLGGCR